MASVKTRIGNVTFIVHHRNSLPFRVFQTPFLYLVNYSTGLKTRGYSPFGLRVLTDAFEW